MRIAIIGAGIVGVTSAYELAADGHEVCVYERHAAVASEASFANAGIAAPGCVAASAAPGMPWTMLRHLFGRHAPLRLGGANALAQMPWMWRWWRACRPAVYRASRGQLYELARYSTQRLHALTQALQLDYEQARGLLVLLRGARDLAQAQAALRLLTAWQVGFELLDAAQCRRLEAGLNADTPLHAGIALPRDEVGNCRQFAQALKAQAQGHGARFLFRHEVQQLRAGPTPRIAVRDLSAAGPGHDGGSGPVAEADFDAVLVCAGHQAQHLLKPLGIKLPIAPIYGYSITAPLASSDLPAAAGPRGAVVDGNHKVAISRLGRRIRVAGSAEIGGVPQQMSTAALATLYKVLDDWFPGAARLSQASAWKGARPMLPDGPPLIGRSRAGGIWLNLGHGCSGWALSCGSARLVADAIAGREPAIDISGLRPQRLGA